jgi:hypothetical protein
VTQAGRRTEQLVLSPRRAGLRRRRAAANSSKARAIIRRGHLSRARSVVVPIGHSLVRHDSDGALPFR